MKNRSEMLQALMHMEYINEAWNELWFSESLGLPKPDENRAMVLRDEIACRIWAAIYLTQFVAQGSMPENYKATIDEANRFNGSDFGEFGNEVGETH